MKKRPPSRPAATPNSRQAGRLRCHFGARGRPPAQWAIRRQVRRPTGPGRSPGHTFHDLIGTHYQQDVDLDKLFEDVAAYNERVMGPAHVHNVVDEAVKTALSQHTVAHINIPKDVQEWDASDLPPFQREYRQAQRRHVRAARFRAHATRAATGRRDHQSLVRRSRSWPGAAVWKPASKCCSWPKKWAGPSSSRCWARPSCRTTIPIPRAVWACSARPLRKTPCSQCDVLIIAGSSFPYLEFYPKPGQAKCVQIDHDPTRIGLRYPPDMAW